MNWILFIIGLALGLISFSYFVYVFVRFIKYRPLGGEEVQVASKNKILLIALPLVTGLFTIMSSFGIVTANNMSLSIGECFLLGIGSYLFATAFCLLVSSFAIYYYRPDLIAKQRKICRIVLYASIPVLVAGLWMLTDAYAPHLNYPLWNTISFSSYGFNYEVGSRSGEFSIKFYGIIIVLGAMVSYFVSDHYFYQKYKKHGLLDTILLIAFPAGVIGGRLWYCLILEPSTNFFDIRNGGMAIQGGALLGIIGGILALLLFRRYINLRWAMDICIPTILLAQVIGRWGNFFNCEVHGLATEMSNWWFLPRIIAFNLQSSSTAPSLIGTSQIYVPLFLIEGLINLAGYFVIRYAIGKPLKKYLSLGDLGMCYFIWYGAVRLLLEPLRYGSYEYQDSIITAACFIAVGVLGIVAFHVYDYIRKRKGLPPKNLDTI